MLKKIIEKNNKHMEKIYKNFKKDINKFFIGPASTNILDNILINYHGVNTKLNKLSHITIRNYNTIKVNLFDISLIKEVKNTILKSKLNLNVMISNKDIIIILPKINEDRRKELIKNVNFESEKNKIGIRKIRRIFNLKIKNLFKNKIINLDEKNQTTKEIQKFTDKYVEKINLKSINKIKNLIKI
ncbi:ribosome recycling factor [Enterobacterales bacterium endosymbiont of Anomoneura mori]|uniref:ribosome-recycling factor n=1 Tax=Enterobacterales bacterium endosymbiont of Anomoneura mori TaxID=3132096 RepID=UPI00399CED3F